MYTSFSVVFGEQPSAAKWNTLGTNDAFFEDFIIGTNGVHAAESSYTPTFANTTLGNGAVAGAYYKFGRMVFFRASFTLGNTSAVGTSPSVSLPATSATLAANTPIGQVVLSDATGSKYHSVLNYLTTTTAQITYEDSSGTYAIYGNPTATVPFTWTTSDIIYVRGSYPASS